MARKDPAVNGDFGTGFDQKDVTHIDLVDVNFLKVPLFHPFPGGLRGHLSQGLNSGTGLVEGPLFQVGAKKKEEGDEGRFLKIPDGKGTRHGHGHQDVDGDHLDPQGLVGLEGDGEEAQDRSQDQGTLKEGHEACGPFDQKGGGDQDPVDQGHFIFIFENKALHVPGIPSGRTARPCPSHAASGRRPRRSHRHHRARNNSW